VEIISSFPGKKTPVAKPLSLGYSLSQDTSEMQLAKRMNKILFIFSVGFELIFGYLLS